MRPTGLLDPLIRLGLRDVFTGRVDDLIFVLRAPVVGWREAVRGTGYERFRDLVESIPSTAEVTGVINRAGLVWLAKTQEGGASPEAYFQSLLARLRVELGGDVRFMNELLMFLVLLSSLMAVVTTLFSSPASALVLVAMGAAVIMLRPGDHRPPGLWPGHCAVVAY